ncbi:MAG TPA: 30S ribosome-binding factor RbfA [Desulfomonilaceae bacterium]|nr:30S ribosome-binding factor RbfA [Desulfomonilaceae bacterium]
MTRFRKDRVAELIHQVIADLLVSKIKDPRVQGVTITDVVLSSDLKSARVYFCSLNNEQSVTHQRGLEAAEGFIRRQLRLELDLKYIPQLSFFYDTAFDNSARISRLLKDLAAPAADDD